MKAILFMEYKSRIKLNLMMLGFMILIVYFEITRSSYSTVPNFYIIWMLVRGEFAYKNITRSLPISRKNIFQYEILRAMVASLLLLLVSFIILYLEQKTFDYYLKWSIFSAISFLVIVVIRTIPTSFKSWRAGQIILVGIYGIACFVITINGKQISVYPMEQFALMLSLFSLLTLIYVPLNFYLGKKWGYRLETVKK